MKWPRPKVALAAIVVAGAIAGIFSAGLFARDRAACGAGFTPSGARCCAAASSSARSNGTCAFDGAPPGSCPPPLVVTDHGCDSPERDVVDVPATTVTIGPSDWEAEGRVVPRTAVVLAFAMDRVEVTAGRACASAVFGGASFCDRADPARAAFGVTLRQASDYCASRGGRLPTEDEWLAAAGGDRPRRYPWGDTGAVCRRAAWGLESGPCVEGGVGPDTVGAHPDGATPLGILDLAGNVAEWVDVGPCAPSSRFPACGGVVRGGSWQTRLATELRTWVRREVAPETKDPTIGFRCAYGGVR